MNKSGSVLAFSRGPSGVRSQECRATGSSTPVPAFTNQKHTRWISENRPECRLCLLLLIKPCVFMQQQSTIMQASTLSFHETSHAIILEFTFNESPRFVHYLRARTRDKGRKKHNIWLKNIDHSSLGCALLILNKFSRQIISALWHKADYATDESGWE